MENAFYVMCFLSCARFRLAHMWYQRGYRTPAFFARAVNHVKHAPSFRFAPARRESFTLPMPVFSLQRSSARYH
jgi:hypothetical protein